MFGCTELLQTQESQRVDCGGRGGRRVETTGRKHRPGPAPETASMPPNSEPRSTFPNGVTNVSVMVSAAPSTPGMAV